MLCDLRAVTDRSHRDLVCWLDYSIPALYLLLDATSHVLRDHLSRYSEQGCDTAEQAAESRAYRM